MSVPMSYSRACRHHGATQSTGGSGDRRYPEPQMSLEDRRVVLHDTHDRAGAAPRVRVTGSISSAP
jgi:hypothetical protein